MRQVEPDDVGAREPFPERRDAGLVRAVADPGEERPLVQPEEVAALAERRLAEGGDDRPAGCREVGGGARRGAAPPPRGGAAWSGRASGARPRAPTLPGRRAIAPASVISTGSAT